MSNAMPLTATADSMRAEPTGTKSLPVLLQCSNLGGMENVAYSLLEQLKSRGMKVRVATPRPWGPGKERLLRIDPELQAFSYKGKFGWRSFAGFRKHAQAICKSADKVWVIGTCVSCLAAARLTGKKVLLSHHYHHFENRKSWWRWKAFYLAFGRSLDAITYPTEFTRNEALKIAPWLAGKTRVVRNGFEVYYESEEKMLELKSKARKSLGIPQDAFVAGNGGWLIPRKRFDVFLRTAELISRKIPNSSFFICGGGPEEGNLRKLATELGIADKVHFQGWITDLSPYYQAWDVLLFNSDFDTLPCTPLEAASHGCLCVASCLYGGLSEFLKDGTTGFLLAEHDAEKLADRAVRLAREPALASRIRGQAVEWLRQEFNNEKALAFYEDYFGLGRNR